MAPRRLNDSQERALLWDHFDGLFVDELSVVYRVSVRTVYRILSKHELKANPKRRKKRKVARRALKIVREPKPCGTNAGYHRHRRVGEYPCDACLKAHSENVQEAKKRRKERDDKLHTA